MWVGLKARSLHVCVCGGGGGGMMAIGEYRVANAQAAEKLGVLFRVGR